MTPSTPYGVFTLFDGIMEANQNIAEWPCGQPHRWGVYAYWTPRKCDPDGVVHIISVYNVVPHSSTKSHAKKKKIFINFFATTIRWKLPTNRDLRFSVRQKRPKQWQKNHVRRTMVYGILELGLDQRGVHRTSRKVLGRMKYRLAWSCAALQPVIIYTGRGLGTLGSLGNLGI